MEAGSNVIDLTPVQIDTLKALADLGYKPVEGAGSLWRHKDGIHVCVGAVKEVLMYVPTGKVVSLLAAWDQVCVVKDCPVQAPPGTKRRGSTRKGSETEVTDEQLDKLVSDYSETLRLAIDHTGIYPGHAWIIREDGQSEMVALAMPAHNAVVRSVDMARQGGPWQVLLTGIDVMCMPDHGTTMDSAWILLCARPGQEPKVGVIEYSYNGGNPIIKPVNWENQFWPVVMEGAGVMRLMRKLAGQPEPEEADPAVKGN